METTTKPATCFIHRVDHGTDNLGLPVLCKELAQVESDHEDFVERTRKCSCGWCVDCGAWA